MRIVAPGQPFQLRSDATHTVSLGLSQTFEAKAKTKSGGNDTEGIEARKFRVLSINTSAISYDFEQAKKPGRTGWTTQTYYQLFAQRPASQFTLSLTHDLWAGVVGVDTSKFDPVPEQRERQLRDLGQYASQHRLDLRTRGQGGSARGTGTRCPSS